MFCVFEGIDGCGKSTQARLFASHLEALGSHGVLFVREPGGTPLGERLREILLDPATGDLSAATEAFLFMAARSHLCRTRIVPALDAGKHVVADRFLWSTVVYQGVAGGLGIAEVLSMGEVALGATRPDLTIVIDVAPEVAFARVGQQDRVEARGLEFQRRVRDAYLTLARSDTARSAVIDGSGSPQDVQRRVLSAIEARGLLRPGAGLRGK